MADHRHTPRTRIESLGCEDCTAIANAIMRLKGDVSLLLVMVGILLGALLERFVLAAR